MLRGHVTVGLKDLVAGRTMPFGHGAPPLVERDALKCWASGDQPQEQGIVEIGEYPETGRLRAPSGTLGFKASIATGSDDANRVVFERAFVCVHGSEASDSQSSPRLS